MAELKNCPKLNFPAYRFRLTGDHGCLRIWDGLRGRWLVLTPEEWVRQHVLCMLTQGFSVPSALVSQECSVMVNGMPQRADVVVYRRSGHPLILVECKSPDVKMTPAVYAQAVRYNAVLGAKYIMLTNGLKHYLYENRPEGYEKLNNMPAFSEELGM